MIRGAHTLVPEADELRNCPGRLNRLIDAAESELEHYPVSVIGTAITFMGAEECDGTVDLAWQDEYLQDVRQRQLPAYVAGV